MKRKHVYLLTFFLIITVLLFKIFSLSSSKKTIDKSQSKMPTFEFAFLNKKGFLTEKELCKGNVIINYFSTDCDPCQYMATLYYKNSEILKNTEILMVSADDSLNVAEFVKTYKINSLKNISVVLDTKKEFLQKFGTSVTPSFFIYKDARFLKKIIGETKIENLIINEN